MSNSTGIKILTFIVGIVGAIFIFPPLLLIGGPLLILTLPCFLYGYKTSDRGLWRAAMSVLLGFLSGLIFLFTIRWFCGIDGGSACSPTFLNYFFTGIAGSVIGIPVMYIGVLVRYFFKDSA